MDGDKEGEGCGLLPVSMEPAGSPWSLRVVGDTGWEPVLGLAEARGLEPAPGVLAGSAPQLGLRGVPGLSYCPPSSTPVSSVLEPLPTSPGEHTDITLEPLPRSLAQRDGVGFTAWLPARMQAVPKDSHQGAGGSALP